MKTYYNPEGDACWIDEEVEIVAWDRDKYFTFKGSDGVLRTDKQWKFSVKRSNRLYELPEGYLDEALDVTRKSAAQALKQLRKNSVNYSVKQFSPCMESATWKEFKSLKKALNFCKGNPDCTFLHASFHYKNGFSSMPLLEKEGGEWFYSGSWGRVSTKTLIDFCWRN